MDKPGRRCYPEVVKTCSHLLTRILFAGSLSVMTMSPALAQAPSSRLVIYGDMSLFAGTGKPDNCILKSRYKIGEPVGFRMTAIDAATGKREKTAQLVVHLTYPSTAGPKTIDVPMRDFQTEANPEREFFVAKWMVPPDATVGIVRVAVSGKDQQGRTAEWKPFPMDNAMLTIVP